MAAIITKINPLLLLLLSVTFGYSQEKPIERYVLPARELDHNDSCVKSILVKTFYFPKNKSKLDTIYRKYMVIYQNNKIVKQLSFAQNDSTPTEEIFYDDLGRITMLTRKKLWDKKFKITQSFSGNSEYPDSTNLYFDNKKTQFYVNTFNNNFQVTRQEYHILDTLRTYHIFKYDDQKRLTRQINVNTNDGFGIILGKSITGTKDKKTLYPNDSIDYDYSTIGDTLVKEEYENGNLEQITKLVDRDSVRVEVLEKYGWGFFSNKEITKKYKDSTVVTRYSFDREKDTTSILRENRSENKIMISWIRPGTNYKSEIFIRKQYDSLGNWTKKSRIRNGILEEEIYRTIKYCR